jgi:hypothetical protein
VVGSLIRSIPGLQQPQQGTTVKLSRINAACLLLLSFYWTLVLKLHA